MPNDLNPNASAPASLRALLDDVRNQPRVFFPRHWPSKPRGKLWVLVVAFLVYGMGLTELMRWLTVKWNSPVPAFGVLAVALLLGLAVAWHFYRRLMQSPVDAGQLPAGWWLEVDAHRLVPQGLRGQTPLALAGEDVSMAVVQGYSRTESWWTLQLRHPRRGTVAELSTWTLAPVGTPDADQATPEALASTAQQLAQALAQRMGWRLLDLGA